MIRVIDDFAAYPHVQRDQSSVEPWCVLIGGDVYAVCDTKREATRIVNALRKAWLTTTTPKV